MKPQRVALFTMTAASLLMLPAVAQRRPAHAKPAAKQEAPSVRIYAVKHLGQTELEVVQGNQPELPDDCQSHETGRKPVPYSGPVGEWKNASEIRYTSSCNDAGLLQQVEVPGLGIVQRTTSSFAGPVVSELVYARLSNGKVLHGKDLIFTVDPEQAQPGADQIIRLKLKLQNNLAPFRIAMPSGQDYDALIRDASGKTVAQWSDGRFFTEIFREPEFPTGEKEWNFEWNLGQLKKPVPAGQYKMEVWVHTQPGPLFATIIDLTL